MRITIDNNDGDGPLDYTPALVAGKEAGEPLTIKRKRFYRTWCTGVLDVVGAGLPVPANRGRVVITSGTGAVLFRGYLSASQVEFVGEDAASGVDALIRFMALEDGWLANTPVDRSVQPASSATHVFPAGQGRLRFLAFNPVDVPEMADDITLSGEDEATTYVTELFQGDGTTTTFTLQHPPFREAGNETILSDAFDGQQLNAAAWQKADPGGCLSLGTGGLRVSGGTGADGATVLQFTDLVEMGGTLIAEMSSVTLNAGSDGVLLGFYTGTVSQPQCVAGIRVIGAAGAQTLAAFVNGSQVGTPFTWQLGHAYVLRVRMHCTELQRVRASYAAVANGGVQSFGGGEVSAAMSFVIELQDMGLASSTAPTVLCQGSIASAPSQCTFAPVNSTALNGSVGALSLMQQGSCSVVSTLSNGSVMVRRRGLSANGADCTAGSAGVLTFYPGHVPQAGELVAVTYRVKGRAAARLQSAAALEQMQQAGLPGMPAWTGHVSRPKARSSADCAAAAQAMLAATADPSCGMAGTFRITANQPLPDVQTGDTLVAGTGANALTVPVEAVVIEDAQTAPELLTYHLQFKASRNERLGFTVSDAVPSDLVQPVALSTSASGANLPGLQVVSASASSLSVDAGTDPPAGGGFEVRTDDASFGSTGTADLVLRSAVRNFSIPRTSFRERFFVRMYDGASPPHYGQWSSAVFTNLPTG